MQGRDKVINITCVLKRRRMTIDKKANALPPARDLQQVAVQGLVPAPVQTGGSKSRIKRHAVCFLGIREGAVDIEQQGLERGYCRCLVTHSHGMLK